MKEALREARKAAEAGEVPVGAVIVKDGRIIGRGRNQIEAKGDPTMHAEIVAIRKAVKKVGSPRLVGCTMYVTVEPCAMCAGAAVLARIEALFAGADSPKSGACGSIRDILTDNGLNHEIIYETGILKEECSAVMTDFFRSLRERKSKRSIV